MSTLALNNMHELSLSEFELVSGGGKWMDAFTTSAAGAAGLGAAGTLVGGGIGLAVGGPPAAAVGAGVGAAVGGGVGAVGGFIAGYKGA